MRKTLQWGLQQNLSGLEYQLQQMSDNNWVFYLRESN